MGSLLFVVAVRFTISNGIVNGNVPTIVSDFSGVNRIFQASSDPHAD